MAKGSGFAAILGAVAVAALASGAALAEPAPGLAALDRRPLLSFVFESLGRLSELRRQLELGPEQKAQLRGLVKARKPDIVKAMATVRAGRKKVRAAIQAEPADEAAIRRAVAGAADSLADAAVLRSRIRREALTILTPKQRGQVDRFLSEAQESADEAFEEFAGR